VEIANSAPIVAPAPAPIVTAPVAATPRAAPTFVAGRDYELAGRGSLPATSGGRVQVVEFFWWGCTPCYAFEADLLRWKEAVEPRIEVVKIPIAWNPAAELHARAYYAAEALGRLDVVQGPFFEEIHRGGNALASAGALAKFFARFGVDAAVFDATFNSNAIDTRVEEAKALAREYGITATPSLVIGGRYVTTPTLAGAPARMFAVVEELADTCEQTLCALLERASAPTREPGRETLDQLRDRAQAPVRSDPVF
jgi:thiol:disulfide interchange protein DsbA